MVNKRLRSIKGPPEAPFVVTKQALTETAANTYTEIAVQIPVSRLGPKLIAYRVYKIFFELSVPDIVTDTRTHTTAILRTNTATAMGSINDENVIAKANATSVDQAAGAITQENIAIPNFWDFAPNGLLLTDPELKLGVQGTANTAAKSARVMILGISEELDPAEFVAAMSVFGNIRS